MSLDFYDSFATSGVPRKTHKASVHTSTEDGEGEKKSYKLNEVWSVSVLDVEKKKNVDEEKDADRTGW